MADEPLCIHDQAPLISARDRDLGKVLSRDFLKRYEVHSYRNAARILAAASPTEFRELVDTLMAFTIDTQEMVEKGGNKTKIALKMDDLLNPRGWHETRIRGDMIIETITREPNPKTARVRPDHQSVSDFPHQQHIDCHKIDFVNNRSPLTWNGTARPYFHRDPTLCGVLSLNPPCVALTRATVLVDVCRDRKPRYDHRFKSKYGARTLGAAYYR